MAQKSAAELRRGEWFARTGRGRSGRSGSQSSTPSSSRCRGAARRAAFLGWSTPSADLLCLIAKHCDAKSLGRLSQACKSWRDGVTAHARPIWQALLYERFPRTIDILRAFPPPADFSFVEYYRQQLATEATEPGFKQVGSTRQLTDYHFTVELVTTENRIVVDSWSGIPEMEILDNPNGSSTMYPRFTVPLDWSAWEHGLWATCRQETRNWGQDRPQNRELRRKLLEEFEFPGAPDVVHMQLELFVSCNINGKPRTVKIFQSRKGFDDCWFEDSTVPEDQWRLTGFFYDRRLLAASFMASDACSDSPELRHELIEENGKRCVDFTFCLYYQQGGDDTMDEIQLLAYLEHGIDWS